MDTYKLIILRLFMITIGRYVSNFVRKIIQGIIISQKKNDIIFYERVFEINKSVILIKDKLYLRNSQLIKSINHAVTNQSLYTATSNFENYDLFIKNKYKNTTKEYFINKNKVFEITRKF